MVNEVEEWALKTRPLHFCYPFVNVYCIFGSPMLSDGMLFGGVIGETFWRSFGFFRFREGFDERWRVFNVFQSNNVMLFNVEDGLGVRPWVHWSAKVF
jgi:hypothetical protein